MTPSQAADLLGHCAAFDNRTVGQVDARAWAAALPDVPADDDAFAAVARFYGTPPAKPGERLWIQPHDVRTHRRAIRAERLDGFVYEPPADPNADDDPQRYLARRRAQLAETGDGARPAAGPIPLEGGPHKDVADWLAEQSLGRTVPGEEDPVRRPGPLGIVCPKCSAPIGRPCRMPGGGERRPHPARRRVALGGAEQSETPQELARRRDAYRHLAAQQSADDRSAS